MKIAYQNWYHDVGENNDYSWPKFFIGSELENPMYLYQYAGVWPNAEVIKSGKYDITAFIPDRIPQTDMIGHVIFGNTHTTLPVKAGSKSYKFENIYLERGGGVLKVHLDQGVGLMNQSISASDVVQDFKEDFIEAYERLTGFFEE